MKRTFLLLAAALIASAAVVMTAGATSQATPGVTAKSILLEGTFPLSGPASGYAPIPARDEGVLRLRELEGAESTDGRSTSSTTTTGTTPPTPSRSRTSTSNRTMRSRSSAALAPRLRRRCAST